VVDHDPRPPQLVVDRLAVGPRRDRSRRPRSPAAVRGQRSQVALHPPPWAPVQQLDDASCRGRRRPWRTRGRGGGGPRRATAARPATPRGAAPSSSIRPLRMPGDLAARRALTARHVGLPAAPRTRSNRRQPKPRSTSVSGEDFAFRIARRPVAGTSARPRGAAAAAGDGSGSSGLLRAQGAAQADARGLPQRVQLRAPLDPITRRYAQHRSAS
jgi:hypothetical protein